MIKWIKRLFKRMPWFLELPLKKRLLINYLEVYNR